MLNEHSSKHEFEDNAIQANQAGVIHNRIIDEIDDYEYIALDYIQDKIQDYSGIVDFANSLYPDQIDVREAEEFVQREHVKAVEDNEEAIEEYLP